MTNRFKKGIEEVLIHEGLLNDTKGDNGGITNFGISLVFLKTLSLEEGDIDDDNDIDRDDIKKLDLEHAKEIYYDNFWKNYYDTIDSEKLAIKLFDVGVNAGTDRSNKLLQLTLKSLGSKIEVDGLIGRNTLGEIKKYKETDILKSYCKVQADFYNNIVKKNPSQKKFINGWLKRAAWLPK